MDNNSDQIKKDIIELITNLLKTLLEIRDFTQGISDHASDKDKKEREPREKKEKEPKKTFEMEAWKQLLSMAPVKDRAVQTSQKAIEKLPKEIQQMLGPILSYAINLLGERLEETLGAHRSAVDRTAQIAQKYAEIGRPLSKAEIAYIGRPFEEIELARLEAKREVEKVMLRPKLAGQLVHSTVNTVADVDTSNILYDIQSLISNIYAMIGEGIQMRRMDNEVSGYYSDIGKFITGQKSIYRTDRYEPGD